MSDSSNKLSKFWQELKRRRVIHVITVYASAAFVIIELINNLAEPLNLPPNLLIIVVIVLAVGFPLAIILSWLYDMTSEGVEKTKPLGEIQEGEKTVVPNAWKIATYVSFVVIIGFVVFNVMGGFKQAQAGSIQSLVVLPFDNFTGDDQLEYFVSGMHASLIGDMGKISGLRVISNTSSKIYRDVDMSVPEIALELKVDAIVEAQVMCLGDSICLQVKVISAYPEEKQLWIADYKEEKSQILNLYNRITKQIADEIKIELSADEERLLTKSKTVDGDAYDAYLMGRYYWDDLSLESLNKAKEYLEDAVEQDPGWAAPYAGLAQVWVGLAQMGFESPEIAGPKIMENIGKAIELDPNFPDSHYISAIIAVWTEWNWEKGEKEFLHALSINPNDAMARIFYAHLLMSLQRQDEAMSQAQRAVELDPLNPLLLGLYSVVAINGGAWEDARAHIEKSLSLDPEGFFTSNILEFVGFHDKDIDKVLQTLRVCWQMEESVLNKLKRISEEEGFDPAYKEAVHQVELIFQESYGSPADLAIRYMMANQLEKALENLEMGFELHDPNMPYITTEIFNFEPLYNNPRFIAITEKMNLPLPNN